MQEIICTYKKTIYRDIQSGFTIFTIKTKDKEVFKKDNDIVCKGYIPSYSIDMPLKIIGEWKEEKNEYCFNVDQVFEYSNDENNTIEFISNKLVKGIAKATAKKIVEVFGNDIFSIVCNPQAATLISEKIPRINKEQATILVSKLKQERIKRELYEYISRFGANYTVATNISDEYGLSSIEKLKESPYTVGKNAGLRFEICDAIARAQGFNYICEDRLNALIYEAIICIMNSGHTYATTKQIGEKINQIVKQTVYPADIPSICIANALNRCKFIKIEKGKPNRIYLNKLWNDEYLSALNVNRLSNCKKDLGFNDKYIDIIEQECNIKYAKLQKQAFNVLKNTGIKIITGGPGTGKTTTINGIIRNYKEIQPHGKIVLCAPTGRAAQRMSESTGMEAFTIHKLLEFTAFGNNVMHKNQNDPINADLIIVDESSMIDISLFNILLSAIKTGTLLILAGDVNQLPSVGPGNVLKDLIKSKKIDVYKLDTVFRQNETSNITYNYRQILLGNNELRCGDDFEIINVNTKEEMVENIYNIMEKLYDKENPFNIQLLAPTKEGIAGIYNLNNELQEKLNHSDCFIKYGKHQFNKNDKIIFTVNNYDKGYYNGDIGTIKYIEENSMIVDICEKDYEISEKELSEVMLSYCMTIHKSQGSEFPYGIIAIPSDAGNILNKNLLFTAISRFKNKVWLIIEGDALNKCLENSSVEKRNTRLKEKINGEKAEFYKVVEVDKIKTF